ncbi:hypothetical protein [Fibrella forsythiae]|uniref:Uncharacterized protein n=1 Tax=Fibrella forsythiae TaxID=2817061 RepID=A0ABS3JDZ2_9BACT|nr:hypothetical protein [Fibrella forsythiae]MBO0947489.1 hypothetical protein [Fibrella forsythiae]
MKLTLLCIILLGFALPNLDVRIRARDVIGSGISTAGHTGIYTDLTQLPTLFIPLPGSTVDIYSTVGQIDRSGWVKADGRALTSLTSTQRTVASSLGWTTNMPNVNLLALGKTTFIYLGP